MALLRHPIDNRVLCIENANDFTQFQQAGVGGIICNYPIKPDLNEAVMHYASSAIDSPINSTVFRHIDESKIISTLFQIEVTDPPSDYYDLSGKKFKPLREAFNEAAIHEPLQQAIMHMAHCFNHATGITKTITEVRLNSSFPNDFHVHETTIVMTLYGNGTLALSDNNDLYTVDKGHIFLIGDKIEHRAPDPDRTKQINRVALLTF